MAKRNYSFTEEKIAKFISEGRGSGELGNYKPWLTIHDVPSTGDSSRTKGWKTGRIHHLLSKIERNYFYLLEWSENVIDIREQFPLDRIDTIEIANEKGIPHIKDKKTDTYIPMTTDFLITIRKNNKITTIARTIKPSEKLEDNRTLEKLEVEREYWERKSVDWAIVTEEDIPKDLAKNIDWIHSFFSLENYQEENIAQKLLSYIKKFSKSNSISLFDSITQFEEDYLMETGVTINYFRYLLANKFVSLRMDKKINLRNIYIHEISFNEDGKGYGSATS